MGANLCQVEQQDIWHKQLLSVLITGGQVDGSEKMWVMKDAKGKQVRNREKEQEECQSERKNKEFQQSVGLVLRKKYC